MNVKKGIIALSVLCGLLFFSYQLAFGHDLTEAKQGSSVSVLSSSTMDWTRDRIISSGASSFRDEGEDLSSRAQIAERDARIRATRSLHDSLGQMFLDSSTTVAQAMETDPEAKQEFAAMVHQAVMLDRVRTTHNEHLVEVFVMLDFWDEQTRLFLPRFMLLSPETGDYQTAEDSLLTGECVIYIQADEIELSPAFIPAIKDEYGNLLFRASTLGSDKRAGRSRVSYSRVPREESAFRTIRGQSTWIRAQRASGEFETDIQLSPEGAERFRRAVSSTKDRCSVIILLN